MEEEAFRKAVSRASPSVVQIETFGGLERVGSEVVAEGPTTGTIVNAEGWIISSLFNFRQQPASILVTLPEGNRAAARIVARDFSRELVLLKVDSDQSLPVPEFLTSSDCRVGQWALALGKTYDAASVTQSVGIVSAVGRAYGKAIQTDAKVSPFNYGGPLIDIAGRVVGILSPISPGTFLEGDSSELYDSGIGFAIPIADVLARLPRMMAGEDVHAGKLGIVAADQNELVGPVRITGSAPGSPAAKTGLQAGDVIVEANGQPVSLLAHFKHALGPVDAGQSMHVRVKRNANTRDYDVVLAEEIPVYRRRYLGLRVASDDEGLWITSIEPDSPAADSKLAEGQRIVLCNEQPISTRQDISKILSVAELDQALRMKTVSEDGVEVELEIVPTTWPEALPNELPPLDSALDVSLPTEIVEIVLGDFPNKAYAIVPPMSGSRELGLLIIYPEPGEMDQQKTQDYWNDFSREHGWIVAVIQSGNPRAWSSEEIQLASRVIGRLDNNYALDKSRTVVGGLGVGGRVALAAAAADIHRVAGVVTLGTPLPKLGLRQANSPLESLDFLLVGDERELENANRQLSDNGYAVNVVPAGDLETAQWETIPAEPIYLWLEGLGRL
jgi:serine protease Do